MSQEPIADLVAERATLGALLLEPALVLPVLRDALPDPKAFWLEVHQVLYAAALALAARGQPIDSVTLRAELDERGDRERAGDLAYLGDLADHAPAASRVAHYAGIVRDRSLRRAVITEAQRAARAAADLTIPIAPTAEAFVQTLATAAVSSTEQAAGDQASELWAVLEDLERRAKMGDDLQGLSCGLQAVDQVTDGWVKGRLIVIAARPKMGKTGFLLHCTREACEADEPVYFVSAEQPRRELLKRLVGMQADLNLRELRNQQALDAHAGRLAMAGGIVKAWQLVIDDRARTASAIRFAVQRYQAQHGRVGLVIVDYLGKLRSGAKQERHDLEIGAITGELARMALDLDVPVILACQLNRDSVKGGQVRRPGPADLRDSGSIEQDAAQVGFLWRKDFHDDWPPHRVQLCLDLNRFGPTDAIDLTFHRETGRWKPYYRLAGVA